MMRFVMLTGMAGAMAACATVDRTVDRVAGAPGVHSDLRGSQGQTMGRVTMRDADGGVAVEVEAMGLMPGAKGLHLHAVGLCEGPKFTSAGAHWNPTMRQHGRDNPQGAHQGDLPNLDIGPDGRGRATFHVAGTNLAQMIDSDGISLMIHAQADDYRTDPSGNSGDRIACAAFR